MGCNVISILIFYSDPLPPMLWEEEVEAGNVDPMHYWAYTYVDRRLCTFIRAWHGGRRRKWWAFLRSLGRNGKCFWLGNFAEKKSSKCSRAKMSRIGPSLYKFIGMVPNIKGISSDPLLTAAHPHLKPFLFRLRASTPYSHSPRSRVVERNAPLSRPSIPMPVFLFLLTWASHFPFSSSLPKFDFGQTRPFHSYLFLTAFSQTRICHNP